jgi:hypothetical protein
MHIHRHRLSQILGNRPPHIMRFVRNPNDRTDVRLKYKIHFSSSEWLPRNSLGIKVLLSVPDGDPRLLEYEKRCCDVVCEWCVCVCEFCVCVCVCVCVRVVMMCLFFRDQKRGKLLESASWHTRGSKTPP